MRKRTAWLPFAASLAMALVVPPVARAVPSVQWLKTFAGLGKSTGRCVTQTTDGGFVAAGGTHPDSPPGAPGYYYIVRMDSVGNAIWEKTLSRASIGNKGATAYAVVQTPDGGFAVFGDDQGNDRCWQPYLVGLDSAGAVRWQATLYVDTLEFGSSIQPTADGGFILAGMNHRSSTYLMKVDSTGSRQWCWSLDENVREIWPTSVPVALACDGGCVTTGRKDSFGLTLWKVSSTGAAVWRRTYSEEHAYDGQSVVGTADSGFAITGLAGRKELDQPSRIYLLKVDTIGAKQWCRYFDGRDYRQCTSVWQTSDSGFVMTGTVGSEQNGVYREDAFILRADHNGNELWYTTISPSTQDAGLCLQQTTDGGYVVCGGLWERDGIEFHNYLFVAKLGQDRTR